MRAFITNKQTNKKTNEIIDQWAKTTKKQGACIGIQRIGNVWICDLLVSPERGGEVKRRKEESNAGQMFLAV